MEAIEVQIERRIIEALEAVCQVPVSGFFMSAAEGELKSTEVTHVAVAVKPRAQTYEPHKIYTVEVDLRLHIEAAESKNGGLFVEEFNAIAQRLEDWSVDDGCVDLSTERFEVQGLQQNAGGDVDFDVTVSQWTAVWNITLSGVIN